ncbi:MAG: DUF5320 domain-containing protein [Dehalococcoidia bacterium]|nr:DUF5320 domain-containing protein [Dehalococcoidia bacterium]
MGRGFGLGFGRGYGRGFGRGGGFGFRGSSPPWPYVSLGRGGLPRGAYYYNNIAAPLPSSYAHPDYSYAPASQSYASYSASMSKEEELSYLTDQAEAIRKELERIDARVQEIETD